MQSDKIWFIAWASNFISQTILVRLMSLWLPGS